MNDVLKQLDRAEQSAFLAWFSNPNRLIVKHQGGPFFGFFKHECEMVDFEKFWLGKMQDMGLFEFTQIQDDPIKYEMAATALGRKVRREYWDGVNNEEL